MIATLSAVYCARAGRIISDVVLLCVTWNNLVKLARCGDTVDRRIISLSKLLLKDGTGYFLFLLVLNVLQIVLWKTGTFFLLTMWATPLSAITLSRFLLDLRLCSVSSQTPLSEWQTDSGTSYSQHQDDTVYLSTFINTMDTNVQYEPR
ncbi:hypothetical protein WOLCODRAFT_26580 [Wolfiporia cocos MD-104 SS10]|uniref:Uncharacterized protein n=1 Tax=Wolfiporia cocos (strain MD-104) TaxID=742152 RepID=A0A2H3K282_WOLCO|nr:hypothetical protein WOLCODRAFT_26580 [Wolfiporia cocos MD-104 SS10]